MNAQRIDDSSQNREVIVIGSYQSLTIRRRSPHGVYMGKEDQEVLLPNKYIPDGVDVGDSFRVFVYSDSSDRPVATTQRPKGVAGDFVLLRVASVGPIGAFFDLGLDKDLLVPFSEQIRPINEGQAWVVRVHLDERTNRLIGSTKLTRFLESAEVKVGDKVPVMVYEIGQDGVRVILEGKSAATIFPDELFRRFSIGERLDAYVKKVREDGAVALSLSPQGFAPAMETAPALLARLERAGGFLPFGDFSSPEDIRREFGLSKGSFKKVIGALYRAGEIELTTHGIRRL